MTWTLVAQMSVLVTVVGFAAAGLIEVIRGDRS